MVKWMVKASFSFDHVPHHLTLQLATSTMVDSQNTFIVSLLSLFSSYFSLPTLLYSSPHLVYHESTGRAEKLRMDARRITATHLRMQHSVRREPCRQRLAQLPTNLRPRVPLVGVAGVGGGAGIGSGRRVDGRRVYGSRMVYGRRVSCRRGSGKRVRRLHRTGRTEDARLAAACRARHQPRSCQ